MTREYDHLFKLLIIGDSGKFLFLYFFPTKIKCSVILEIYFMCPYCKHTSKIRSYNEFLKFEIVIFKV